MRLGIDFGTTRTVIAAVRDGRYPVASFHTAAGFQSFLPGLAAVGASGGMYGTDVGEAEGERLIRSVKALITGAAPDERLQGAEGATALELATNYLLYVKRMLLEESNLEIAPDEALEAMVAVPAHASTRQRYLTLEAFRAAGFEVLGLLNEPTAGAVEYAHHSLGALTARSPKRYVVVYDLGGGTFDTAAVSLKERRFDLIGAEGVSGLGGNDFDQIIAEEVLKRLAQTRESLEGDMWERLLERCRVAKEGLSSSSKRLFVDTGGLLSTSEVVLDVEEVYRRAVPLIQRTLEATDLLLDGLRAHGIDPENSRELGAVYLVGGAVQFPAVLRELRKRFGRKIQLAPEPHASTAIGLAIAADEDAGLFVREAPTRHFGVWREELDGFEKVFDPIIEKRHGVSLDAPLRIERSYRPAHKVGCLRFVECTDLDEGRTPRGEVTPWDNVLFPYDPALLASENLSEHLEERGAPGSEQEIREIYEYASTGVIRVAIENMTSGYRREFVLGSPAHHSTAI